MIPKRCIIFRLLNFFIFVQICLYSISIIMCKKQENNHNSGIQTNWNREENIWLGGRRREKDNSKALLYNIFLNEIIGTHWQSFYVGWCRSSMISDLSKPWKSQISCPTITSFIRDIPIGWCQGLHGHDVV